jgi:hypothetical protein
VLNDKFNIKMRKIKRCDIKSKLEAKIKNKTILKMVSSDKGL